MDIRPCLKTRARKLGQGPFENRGDGSLAQIYARTPAFSRALSTSFSSIFIEEPSPPCLTISISAMTLRAIDSGVRPRGSGPRECGFR